MLKKIREYFAQKGQGVVEYALLLGFVAVIAVAFTGSDNFIGIFRRTLGNIVSQFTTFNEAYDNAPNYVISPDADPDF
ncbi:MAG: hypothetical protein IJK81_09740 [Selenomonadaceae bacterium]|nr:hypothetical protein [Selenomonadaceae bacterium]